MKYVMTCRLIRSVAKKVYFKRSSEYLERTFAQNGIIFK